MKWILCALAYVVFSFVVSGFEFRFLGAVFGVDDDVNVMDEDCAILILLLALAWPIFLLVIFAIILYQKCLHRLASFGVKIADNLFDFVGCERKDG